MTISNDWTPQELKSIRALQRAFARKPATVRLYTTDGEINACKKGVASRDLCTSVAGGGSLWAGAVLTDMHDDMSEAMAPE